MSADRYVFVFFDLQCRTSSTTISPYLLFSRSRSADRTPRKQAPVLVFSAAMNIVLHANVASRRCVCPAHMLIGFELHYAMKWPSSSLPIPAVKSRTYTKCINNLCGDFFVGCVACVRLCFFGFWDKE